MQADHPEHLPEGHLDGYKCHGAGVVDLGETRDEGVAELLHRREEPQPQVLLRDRGEERPIQGFVFRPHRADNNSGSIAQRHMPFPFRRIGPDGEAGMARRAAPHRVNGSDRHAGVDGNNAALVG